MIDATQQRITALEKKVGPDAKSPLFAQLAQYYLEINRAQDALRVCDAGLANFPFYTTGHLVKGKALIALNLRSEARREFEFVLGFLPNNVSITTLLNQIPPSEDESITAVPQLAQEEISQSEPPASSGYNYSTPSPAPGQPEPSYGGGQIEPEAPQVPSLYAEPSSGSSFFDTITQTLSSETPETSLGAGFEAPTAETPAAQEPFAGFDFPAPEPAPYSEPSPLSAEQPSGFDFTMPLQNRDLPASASPLEEESFEQYAERRRGELPGANTLSLEDYFNNVGTVSAPGLVDLQFPTPEPFGSMTTGVQNKIEELANNLQSAGKITPVINFAQKETAPASEQDTPASMGFVTPTLAEIYAKQGWYDDAIKAYKTLARNKPAEKERYEKRIAELEELKSQGSG